MRVQTMNIDLCSFRHSSFLPAHLPSFTSSTQPSSPVIRIPSNMNLLRVSSIPPIPISMKINLLGPSTLWDISAGYLMVGKSFLNIHGEQDQTTSLLGHQCLQSVTVFRFSKLFYRRALMTSRGLQSTQINKPVKVFNICPIPVLEDEPQLPHTSSRHFTFSILTTVYTHYNCKSNTDL